MAINVGELTREVMIEQMTESVGASGLPVESWDTLCTAWMSRLEQRGAERFANAQLSATAISVWTMRYRDDMDPELVDVPKLRRLNYQGRTYDISSATHVGRKDGIELVTIAGEAR